MDVLDQILSSLRLTGGVVIDGEMRGDFCLLSQITADHCAPFFPVPDAVIGYHYVRSGQLVIEVEGEPALTLHAGEAVLLPRNTPHLLSSAGGRSPVEAEAVSWVTEAGIHRVACGTGADGAKLWCGFLGTSRSSLHPIFEALPPMLKLDVRGGQARWLDSSLQFLAEDSPPADVVARLAEAMLAQAVREYLDRLPNGEGGWLRGLRDPAVARALAVIHARYAEELDVEILAREAGVSRSVLGERFADLLGEPPMRYCARWRMRTAAAMLREGKENTANIAYSVGFNSEAAFNRAFKRAFGEPPATWKRHERERADAEVRGALPQQTIRYCTAHDGTRLAYSVVGEGSPLVKTANWLNHLEYDFDSPIWRPWMREFTRDYRLVRYDERGNGLSDWNTPDLSLDAFVDDFACVVDAAGVERFDIFGISQGAPVAIAYAVRHPERVRRIVLCGGYAAGWRARGDTSEISKREAMITLTELGWGSDHPTFRQMFTNLYVPGATAEQTNWFNELQRRTTSAANAAALMRALSLLDVRDLLASVTQPTLVFHARGDRGIPFEVGKALADGIPTSRFVPLESDNHILLGDEPAFRVFIDEMRRFLAAD